MRLYKGDCLIEMDKIPDGSVDMIMADVPYGTTACAWDSIIPLEPMWKHLKRVIKPNGAIVMTASDPFTSALIMSNVESYKYKWIWEKTKATGFFDAKKRPLNNYEDVPVFYKKPPVYNPQMTKANFFYKRGLAKRKKSDCYGEEKDFIQEETGMRYPKRIIRIGNASTKGIVHPTQKPVKLMEYLIKTYTNEGETVCDFTMGSGTTGVACVNLGRDFIGIEKDDKFFETARKRIQEAKDSMGLFK